MNAVAGCPQRGERSSVFHVLPRSWGEAFDCPCAAGYSGMIPSLLTVSLGVALRASRDPQGLFARND